MEDGRPSRPWRDQGDGSNDQQKIEEMDETVFRLVFSSLVLRSFLPSSLFLLVFSSIFLSSFFLAREARGDEFRLVPSLALKQEYNDNVFFSSANKSKDFISTVSPGLEIVDKTEKIDLNLNGRLDQRMYWNNTGLDNTDQAYKGSLGYQATPNFRATGRASYTQDSLPDYSLLTTGLVLFPVKHERQNYGGTTEYSLTERTNATLGYDYLKDHYLYRGFVNSESNVANLGFIHDLSYLVNATKGRINFGAGRYRFTGSQIDNYSGTLGFSKQFGELWSVSLDTGARYTWSTTTVVAYQFVPPFFFVPTTQEQKSSGAGWIGNAALTYKGEKTNAELSASYDLLPAYGYSGMSERTAASLSVSRRFTYELQGSLSAIYFLNKAQKAQFSVTPLNQEVFNIIPSLRYEPNRDVAIEASYTFTYVHYKNLNQEADRNLFMIRLILQHAFFE